MRFSEKVSDRMEGKREHGFTLVELMIVMIVSLIMMAGMIGLLYMSFNTFKKHRDLNALTNSSRRSLQMISRELRSNLQLVNENCTDTKVEFYADIDADNADATVDAGSYENAEMITLTQSGSTITQTTYDPDTSSTSTVVISDNVATGGLSFAYYEAGANPADAGVEPLDPSTDNINKDAGMVRVSVVMEKGKMERTFHQDVFLRAIDRMPEGFYCVITRVTPSSLPGGSTNVLVTIEGSNTQFINGTSEAVFTGIDLTVVTGSTTRIDDEKVTCRVTIAAGATPGFGDVTVITGSEYPDPLEDGFEITI